MVYNKFLKIYLFLSVLFVSSTKVISSIQERKNSIINILVDYENQKNDKHFFFINIPPALDKVPFKKNLKTILQQDDWIERAIENQLPFATIQLSFKNPEHTPSYKEPCQAMEIIVSKLFEINIKYEDENPVTQDLIKLIEYIITKFAIDVDCTKSIEKLINKFPKDSTKKLMIANGILKAYIIRLKDRIIQPTLENDFITAACNLKAIDENLYNDTFINSLKNTLFEYLPKKIYKKHELETVYPLNEIDKFIEEMKKLMTPEEVKNTAYIQLQNKVYENLEKIYSAEEIQEIYDNIIKKIDICFNENWASKASSDESNIEEDNKPWYQKYWKWILGIIAGGGIGAYYWHNKNKTGK